MISMMLCESFQLWMGNCHISLKSEFSLMFDNKGLSL